MPRFLITFINPAEKTEQKILRASASDMEQALADARDAFFFDTPLRAATWVVQKAELVED